MTIFVKVKSLSKRKTIIEGLPFEITEEINSAESLIEIIVRHNVREHNNQPIETRILPYLTSDDITNGETIGKIGFGDRKNEKNQNPGEAVKNALQCFEDGVFRLFVNEDELPPGDALIIKDGDEVTFIRLTMLAGRLW